MKKWKVVIMAITMVGMLGLTACGNEKDPNSGDMKEDMGKDEMMEENEMNDEMDNEMNNEMDSEEKPSDM